MNVKYNINKSHLLVNDLDSCGGPLWQLLPQEEGGEPANGLKERGQITKEAVETRTLMFCGNVESPPPILLYHVGL